MLQERIKTGGAFLLGLYVSLLSAWLGFLWTIQQHGTARPAVVESYKTRLNKARQQMDAHDFRAAQITIAILWVNGVADSGTTSTETMERQRSLRKLLAQCLNSLKKPKIAKYVLAAPFAEVNIHLIQTGCDATLLPSYDQYMKEVWTVTGYTGKESHYRIAIPGIYYVDPYSFEDGFDEIAKCIGPINRGEERKISPLPGEVIDRWTLNAGKAKSE